jgi:hypothetical protein
MVFMNERVHKILDGEEPRSALNDLEREELAAADSMISTVLRSIPAEPLPDLARAVLRQIGESHRFHAEQPAPSVWQRLRNWVWTPRPVFIHWRPAYAFAVALIVLCAGTVALTRSSDSAAEKQVLVQFRFDAPQATRVALAGNFTNWQPSVQLNRSAGGVWTVVVPLVEGVHKYAFVIDGKVWQADPLAPSVSDGFGGANSQIAILSPDVLVES